MKVRSEKPFRRVANRAVQLISRPVIVRERTRDVNT